MATLSLKKKTKYDKCDAWLHTFPLFQKRVPMRVGIFEELKVLQRAEKNNPGFGWQEIQRQLGGRTRQEWYRVALRGQAPRCNLDGSEVDPDLIYSTGNKKPLDRQSQGA